MFVQTKQSGQATTTTKFECRSGYDAGGCACLLSCLVHNAQYARRLCPMDCIVWNIVRTFMKPNWLRNAKIYFSKRIRLSFLCTCTKVVSHKFTKKTLIWSIPFFYGPDQAGQIHQVNIVVAHSRKFQFLANLVHSVLPHQTFTYISFFHACHWNLASVAKLKTSCRPGQAQRAKMSSGEHLTCWFQSKGFVGPSSQER